MQPGYDINPIASQSLHKTAWNPAGTPALAGRCHLLSDPHRLPYGVSVAGSRHLPSLEDPPTMGILLGRAWQTPGVRPEDVS